MNGRYSSSVFAVTALLGLCLAVPCRAMAASPYVSRGMAAIENAARSNKYLFIFFWKQNDQNTGAMFQKFKEVMPKMADRADPLVVHVADPAEKPMVDKFGVSRAPMPLVVALAPNGAITKGCPVKFDEKQLQEAFVSPCTAECMKALQNRKLVLLCVQNHKTQFNQVALRGVQEFKADARFARATEVVALDPSDHSEASFLNDLRVNPQTPQAVTILLAPPGTPVATFTGPVTKDQLVTKLAAAKSDPCAGGKCGPGGCKPKKP